MTLCKHCGTGLGRARFEQAEDGPTTPITNLISRYFELPADELLNGSRQKLHSYARSLIWYFLFELDMSYRTIGERFNGRDHSTIVHGCEKIRRALKTGDKHVQYDVRYLARKILTEA